MREQRLVISETLLKEVDEFIGYPRNRTAFIEEAVKAYPVLKRKTAGDNADLQLINNSVAELNEQAEDVLDYQMEL